MKMITIVLMQNRSHCPFYATIEGGNVNDLEQADIQLHGESKSYSLFAVGILKKGITDLFSCKLPVISRYWLFIPAKGQFVPNIVKAFPLLISIAISIQLFL